MQERYFVDLEPRCGWELPNSFLILVSHFPFSSNVRKPLLVCFSSQLMFLDCLKLLLSYNNINFITSVLYFEIGFIYGSSLW